MLYLVFVITVALTSTGEKGNERLDIQFSFHYCIRSTSDRGVRTPREYAPSATTIFVSPSPMSCDRLRTARHRSASLCAHCTGALKIAVAREREKSWMSGGTI